MTELADEPLPRSVVAARALALEVALGAFGGAVGVLVLGPVFLRAPDLSLALRAIAGLALWCALLAVVVRVARAGRRRVRPALTVVMLAAPALWLVGPVALATSFAGSSGGFDPFRAWGAALEVFGETFTPRTLSSSLALGAAVPFVLVGVCAASRPRTPTLALALLGAAAGYLGLVATLGLLRRSGLDVVLDGARQAFLCGVPCAVAAMTLAPRLPSPADLAADIEQADRRAWGRLALSCLAVLALIGAGARGHVRHTFDALVRTQGWSGGSSQVAGSFGRGVWLEQLDDPREAVKLVSMQALSTFGSGASRATPALLRLATRNASATVRRVAIDTVAAVCVDGIRYEATQPAMVELALNDPDATVRAGAIRLLADMADPAAAQALFEVLRAEATRPSTRRAALFALQFLWSLHRRDERSPSPAALADALLRAHVDPAYTDPDSAPHELYVACVQLDFDFVEHLARALSDEDPRVRRLAALTLRDPLSYTLWRLTPEQRRQVDETR